MLGLAESVESECFVGLKPAEAALVGADLPRQLAVLDSQGFQLGQTGQLLLLRKRYC
mgnify:CR=1 FL=1